jgi:hypothetical protein
MEYNEHRSPEFERSLTEAVVKRVMETDEAQELKQVMLAEAAKQHESDDAEKEVLYKRLATVSYNAAVKDVKLHDNRGINPVSLSYLRPKFLSVLCGLKVYTHQKLLSMEGTNEAYSLDAEGCYIVYNTFNNKYFVGRSDRMFRRVHELLASKDFSGCVELKNDINSGHFVLVKFVLLKDSGYSKSARLQRDLILSYDCRQGRGYNK